MSSLPCPLCVGWRSQGLLLPPWQGGPGKNISGLAEVVEGGETITTGPSRMIPSDMGTLNVRLGHQNFMVHGGAEKLCSPKLEGIKQAFSHIFSLWGLSSCPPVGKLLVLDR